MQFWKLYKVPLLLTFVSFFLYWFFAYELERTDYTTLILLYSGLFLVFLLLLKYAGSNIRLLSVIAVLSRIIFIIAIPNLSQDFYRFIWDGRMILEGMNPYLFTPESLVSSGNIPVEQGQILYDGMGELNGSHFTNYPPINQLCFFIAAIFSGKSILGAAIVFRVIIIAADLGILYFGKRLLKALNIPVKNIFWYLLNPFIIIELTGNLHFEGVMLFFLVWSLYVLHQKKWKWAALLFACSISVKLIPLMFLTLLFFYFKKDNSVQINVKVLFGFYAIVGLITIALFAPFFSTEFVTNYAQTVALWFQNFEFNASIYYLLREIGFSITGYNEIKLIGKVLPILVILYILWLSLYRKAEDTSTLIRYMLLAFAAYLFMSTTVHPWYIATLLLLSVFTNYKFPIVWSFVIILSYLAYLNINKADKSENLWIIALEYVIVYGVFIKELITLRNTKI
ncbi:glycosyltransferase 87 family protein [Psychroserpens sp.]|uniref:glycosyltransferase 87 family protein n=1 Tax=Psychroserpens sp. TaxID=2020870 RepID=UPI001B2E9E06|nr:glycosyltransferase 87 family protein [Psychroserpens sp.]MBO6605766.1 mannosyltransferase [Psychroserpens sp.]MBO6632399.1 mannosyltransferase [Psychroserpens sp.]MBO6652863.1 mannosyltransferase [Psychroserpens sp.]MBO6681365.1 mannosyltransferase [Psychroserpens sp.]MBO6749140.1 mannosyltransferase [Psychroserpens sp.]